MIYWENLQRKNSERKIATDDAREKKGDMVSLLDSEDAEVVSYRYNGWSKILETVDTSDNQIAARNPFCYRGYILAEETGMYCLKSRYYNPETGRSLNADNEIASVGIIAIVADYDFGITKGEHICGMKLQMKKI